MERKRIEIFVPRDIQLLFVVPPLSKGRNVEVVDNVCANSCELTAYIALRVSPSLSLSLCLSVSFFLSSSLYSLFRSLRSCFLFSPSHLTSFDSVFFKASFAFFPSRFCVLDRISFRLYRDGMTELSFQTLHGYIYI